MRPSDFARAPLAAKRRHRPAPVCSRGTHGKEFRRAVQTFRHVAILSASGYRPPDRILSMLALLCNAALEECISAWRRSGAGISLYDRFRSLTAVPRQDPDWRRIRVLVDRSAAVPLNRAIAEQNWREILDALKCRAASVRVSFVESTPVGMSPDCSHCGTRASEALSERLRRVRA